MMKWKNISTKRLAYLWLTYIVSHFRYGAFIFVQQKNIIKGGKLKGLTLKFRKKLNETVKKLYGFPKATSTNIIDNIMENCRTDVIYLANYS